MRRLRLLLVALFALVPALAGAQSSDNFNRANGGLGANWTTQIGSPAISSNEAYGNSLGNDSYAFESAGTFGANQFSQATVKAIGSNDWTIVVARASGTAGSTNGYYFYARATGASSELWKLVAGAYFLISNTGYGPVAVNDVLRVEVSSTSITVKDNGTQIGTTQTDTSHSSGRPGLGFYPNTSVTAARLDDWSGGDLGGGGAVTYYVATTGSDSNPGTVGSPFLTISKGASVTAPGDTVYIRGGIYTGTANRIASDAYTVPSGTSTGWGTTDAGAITIKGYPGETATIRHPNGTNGIKLVDGSPHYLIIQDLTLDGSLSTSVDEGVYIANNSHHIRLQRITAAHYWSGAMQFSAFRVAASYDYTFATFIELLDSDISDAGLDTSDTGHGGPGLNNGYCLYALVDYLTIRNTACHDNPGSIGFNIYGDNVVMERNRVYHNGRVRAGSSKAGINICSAAYGDPAGVGGGPALPCTNWIFRNNLVYDNDGPGVQIYTGATGVKVYGNSIYGNSGYGVLGQYYSSGPIIRNNIIYSNSSGSICDLGFTGSCTGGTATQGNNLTTNPGFTNPGVGDFTITSSSPAFDAGANLSPDLTDDFVGTARPVAAAYDIGAYEVSARTAGTFYVSTTGSNSNAGTLAAPWLTLCYATSQLIAGDTLYIRGGTWTGTSNRIDSQSCTVPSGSSSNPLTISAYTGETVTIQPPNGEPGIRFATNAVSYATVQNVIVDMVNSTTPTTTAAGVILTHGSSFNTFTGVEVKRNSGTGVLIGGSGADATNNTFSLCTVHDNGAVGTPDSGDGFQIKSADTTVDRCDIYANAGHGLLIYNSTGNTSRTSVTRNRIHGNGTAGGNAYAVLYAYGADGKITNNEIFKNLGANIGGILVYTGTDNVLVANNSIVSNTWEGVVLQYYAGAPVVRNNIVYGNFATIQDNGGAVGVVPTIDHNLEDVNPNFVNVGADNYHLQASSVTAIDLGIAVSGLTTDIDGDTRPQGANFDIGSDEFVGTPVSGPAIDTRIFLPQRLRVPELLKGK